MIFRADSDKPHRCPVCWTIPDEIWESSRPMWRWHVYRCRQGHRFTKVPLLGRRLYGLIVETEEHQLRLSWRGWIAVLLGRGQMVSWVVHWDHAWIERYWTILTPRCASDGRPFCAECRRGEGVDGVEST